MIRSRTTVGGEPAVRKRPRCGVSWGSFARRRVARLVAWRTDEDAGLKGTTRGC